MYLTVIPGVVLVAGMNREQAIEALKAEQGDTDIEIAHANADNVLCKLLTELGFEDVVAEFEKVEKWYA